MKYVSESFAQKSLTSILDTVQKEPVVICQNQQEVAVVLSRQDYEKLIRANIEDFQQFCDEVGQQAQAKGLTEEELQQILERSLVAR